MAGKLKLTARAAFDDNLNDARTLLSLADALTNQRIYRMRKEKRGRVGDGLGLPKKDHDSLDCIESNDFFVVLKPKGSLKREDLDEPALRSLSRQALVAACAAIETFVGDRVMERLGAAVKQNDPPGRLKEIALSVGDWLAIEERYQRRGWGLRQVVEPEIRRIASPAPSQIAKALAIVGETNLWKRVDKHRGVGPGKSMASMERINDRRNRIAHQGDRDGRGRAMISVEEVRADLVCIEEIVNALDELT